jgi:poly(A) polymerase
MLLVRALENTDKRIAEDKPVTPAFLFAALLWAPMQRQMQEYQTNGVSEHDAMVLAADTVISRQIAKVAIPRRFTQITREIWGLQPRFQQRGGGRPFRLMPHPRFRAAYDFLVLRAEAGEDVQELAQWWTEFQHADEVRRKDLQGGLPGPGGSRRPRRRKKRNNNATKD